MVFSVRERERVRERVLERAQADARVVAGAVVGAEAHGSADRWSDIDLTFGLIDGARVDEVLADWTKGLAAELDAVDLFDVQVGSTVYRVFLLPGNLQVDLSLTPEAEFGALGPDFRLLFGTAGERAGQAAAAPQPARHLFGLGVHHAVRRGSASSGADHGRPSIGSAERATRRSRSPVAAEGCKAPTAAASITCPPSCSPSSSRRWSDRSSGGSSCGH